MIGQRYEDRDPRRSRILTVQSVAAEFATCTDADGKETIVRVARLQTPSRFTPLPVQADPGVDAENAFEVPSAEFAILTSDLRMLSLAHRVGGTLEVRDGKPWMTIAASPTRRPHPRVERARRRATSFVLSSNRGFWLATLGLAAQAE